MPHSLEVCIRLTPRWFESVAAHGERKLFTSWLVVKEEETGPRFRDPLKGLVSNDLKISQEPPLHNDSTTPQYYPSGDYAFAMCAFGGHLRSKLQKTPTDKKG